LRTFHEALAETMTARGMTQQQLADAVGVKQNTVSRWVNGDATPEPATVFEVESALKAEPGALSQHLGYIPVGVDRVPCTIIEAIHNAVELQDYHRSALLSVYRSFIEPNA
jgi:transcriptional regulator with XRE-family HTH domain